MFHVPTEQFEAYVSEAVASLPETHRDAINNVGFFVRDNPSEEQAERSDLHPGYTLLGLYEGVPLAQRQGTHPLFPDRITIFQNPIEAMVGSLNELKEQIAHTVWHEVGHYFGLNHDDIARLEQ